MPTYIFDDVFGDQRPGSNSPLPAYLPPPNWDPVHGTCSQCSMTTNIRIPVDPSQVMNGTWHTATSNPGKPIINVTMTFTGKKIGVFVARAEGLREILGTSVTAYCLLPPNLDSEFITSQMNMTFVLDGEAVGTYHRIVDPSATTWTYNQNVFSTSGLKNTVHTFAILPQSQYATPSQYPATPYLHDSSFLSFDYITYDFDDSPSPPLPPSLPSSTSASGTPTGTAPVSKPPAISSTSSRGDIIAGVGCGVSGLLIVLLLSLWCGLGRRARAARRPFIGFAMIRGQELEVTRIQNGVAEGQGHQLRTGASTPPSYNMIMPLTASVLGKHDLMENIYSHDAGPGDANLTRMQTEEESEGFGGMQKMQEEVVPLGDVSEDPQILRLRTELDNLRAERDVLWLALGGQDVHDERSASSVLPSYRDALQSRRNDTTFEYSP
ncbi:hypothetical protein PHLGIDRAFT_455630 [Phlebiopsis gigantea 11061_1 CR5-6]|uniref:Uncharacterized protein n=1 Tax=Phlebiopsis gigantea (strain 11061_1 CR5-6) TaxID=745531 RepID=A0A0C3SF65_PHLG1|nr:hypothetical protein PHLGIDRAFT_455630 [Phlebiopsis gigantea 11061_1 CR5-6]